MNDLDIPASLTILQAIEWASKCLDVLPFSNKRLDSELLLAQVVGYNRLNLYLNFDQPLSVEENSRFRDMISRRMQGEPVQYLTGVTEFYGRRFSVSPAVLIPRPETEILIDHVLPFLDSRSKNSPSQPVAQLDLFTVNTTNTDGPLSAIDIGTGSGNIIITLASEMPPLNCYATDISPAALGVAERNAEKLSVGNRISFLQGNLTDPLANKLVNSFDLIISNPPYIRRDEISQLPVEIRDFEPAEALDGGVNGIEVYDELIDNAPIFLKSGGMLAFEIGSDQADAVVGLLDTNQAYSNISVVKDYNRQDRVVSALYRG